MPYECGNVLVRQRRFLIALFATVLKSLYCTTEVLVLSTLILIKYYHGLRERAQAARNMKYRYGYKEEVRTPKGYGNQEVTVDIRGLHNANKIEKTNTIREIGLI